MCAVQIDALLVREIAFTDREYGKSFYCGLASDSVYPSLVSSEDWRIRCTEFSWSKMFRVDIEVEVESEKEWSELSVTIGTAQPEVRNGKTQPSEETKNLSERIPELRKRRGISAEDMSI